MLAMGHVVKLVLLGVVMVALHRLMLVGFS